MRRLRNGERVMAMRSLRHQGVNVGEGDRGIVGSVVGAWNYADARKSKDLPQATRRKDRALARQYRYENAALLKAGLTP
jgi:hypothetical protein